MMRMVGLLMVACASPALAQESRGTIIGRVSDPSGAMAAGARIQAVNVATNAGAASVTNDQGNYEIPYLLPGTYRISVELAGFKKAVRDGIELRVNDRMTLDFALEIGDVAESVVVTGETPLLESATASIGMVMDERRATELPVVGGNAFYLARLAPGILSAEGRGNGQNPFDGGSATGTIIVNGTRSGSSEVTLDGAPNMFERSTAYAPPQDLVQEFRINTAAYDASLGHAAGAVTNVSLKSGGNALHGTGYLFDSRFRGRPWFLNRWLYDPTTGPITSRKIQEATPGWLHQRWGTTLTGPVVLPKIYAGRSRTFWSFGYEGVRVSRETTFTGTLPSLEQRKGDFSALLRLGAQYQVYDPMTIAPAPAGRFSRQPLAGNIIPASRLDPIAQKLLTYWPEPNQTGTADGRQNYFRIATDKRLWGSLLGRIDHNFSEKHRVFFRVNNNQWDQTVQQMPTIANGNTSGRPGYGLVADDVYVFNPQLLLNLRYGLTYQRPWASRLSQGFDLLSLGLPQRLLTEIQTKNNPRGIAFPEIAVDGYTSLGADGGNSRTIYYQTFGATVTRISGNHSLRFGGEYRLMRENGYDFGNVAPRLDFGAAWTRGPLDNSPAAPIGQGLASMLLGIASGGTIDINASRAEQSSFTALYWQDDWRLTPRLTLNLGLRWEFEGPTTERFNRSIRGFDFQTPSPVEERAKANYARAPIPELPAAGFSARGGLTFAGVGAQPRSLWLADKNNLAPRVALAYQLSKKTVVRAGYGVFYDVTGIDRGDVNQGGFNQPTNLIASLDNGLTFRARPANPFPDGLEAPLGAAGGLRTFLGRGVSFFEQECLNPYMQRWSFSVQRELATRTVIEAAYVGNRGTKIMAGRQFDPAPRRYLSTSAARDQVVIDFLSEQVANPFSGLPEFAGTGLSGVRTSRGQLLRPYPHFTGISASPPAGYSYYHSLQLRVEKQWSKGLTFQASWTWSKFMDASSFLNDTDPVPYKVISDQDFTHRFVLNAIYELPLGRGKPLGRNAGAVVNHVIGGWQLQGWFEGQTGQVLGFGNAILYGSLKDVPLPAGQRSAERWFNTGAGFERDPRKQLASNIQTFPSRFSGIRGDGINNFDLSLFKNFRIREGLKAQFRLEAFNALNHVQLGGPNTSPTSTAFGSITGEKGHGQRQVTLALKVLF
ncbi:MAG: TonB-dependent receptor [Acidobacteriota bacterium]